jgi:hypothetical protein
VKARCTAGTNYCEGTWLGITCEGPNSGIITALNLTALDIKVTGPAATLPLLGVVATISNLTQLQSLVLAGIGLSGPVHQENKRGMDAFVKLRHLNISSNPDVTGSLPVSWFAMRALTALDISNTGIGGTLPDDFAAFQELRMFRAVNCPGLSGQLPPSWGLLQLEVLEMTNTALTGELPAEWADAAALQRAAAALAASLEVDTAAADGLQSKVLQASAQPGGALGLQRLRVLDLSVSEHVGRGGLAGGLPAAYAQLDQLQVIGGCRDSP